MIDCAYRNGSDRMVIVRCVGPQEFYLERVVFPFELLSFLCPQTARVEIWSHCLGGPELVETIAAAELACDPISGPIGSDLHAVVGEMPIENSPWLEAG